MKKLAPRPAAALLSVAALSLGSLAALSLGGAPAVPAGAAPARPPAARHAARALHAGAPIRFSRMVVVDQQRPGFEPDVKTNRLGRIFTSIPFGFSTTSSFVWRSADHGNSYQLVPGNVGSGKPTTCIGGGTPTCSLIRTTRCTSPTCRA